MFDDRQRDRFPRLRREDLERLAGSRDERISRVDEARESLQLEAEPGAITGGGTEA